MKKLFVLILFFLFSLSFATALFAAGNDLYYSEDTVIHLDDLNRDFTIKAGSQVESINIGVSTISATLAAGSTFTVQSADRLNLNPSSGTAVCPNDNVSPSYVTLTAVGAITISPTLNQCAVVTGAIINTGGGGGGGGSVSPTPTPTPTPIATTTPNPVTTPATTAPITSPPATLTSYVQQWQNILTDAAIISSGNLEIILSAVGAIRNLPAEVAAAAKYTASLINGIKGLSVAAKNTLTNFITYGTPTTKKLGAGERAGVLNSYKAAFNRVPVTEAQWKDAIAIGNGRWPAEKSAVAEAKAIVEFKKVYKRSPDLKQPNDNAAVTVIAYGLRPANRNLNSEKVAIKSFKYIYGYAPVLATAWDIVRAIAYSGAKR